MYINHNEKGFLIRVYDPDKTRKSLDNYDLGRKIAEEIKGAENEL